jgi:hypothetical protein
MMIFALWNYRALALRPWPDDAVADISAKHGGGVGPQRLPKRPSNSLARTGYFRQPIQAG